MESTPNIKLSICISTLNRAAYIGGTLQSIISQAPNNCEIVVLDAASIDDTETVVKALCEKFDRLRYIKQETNNGIDRDFDRTVELSRGEYCWFVCDDDFLKPGALIAVLDRLQEDLSLIILNAETRDINMSKLVLPKVLDIPSNKLYAPDDLDLLFEDTGPILQYIGCVIIKRAIWLARRREQYYGSLFIHVGVVFQERLPGNALVMSEPLVMCRRGNDHTFSTKLFEVIMFTWPTMVWSLAPSSSSKTKVSSAEPWREFATLLRWRAIGIYSLKEYRRLIRPRLKVGRPTMTPALVAVLPGVLLNAVLVMYYSSVGNRGRVWLDWLKGSPFFVGNWLRTTRKAQVTARTQ